MKLKRLGSVIVLAAVALGASVPALAELPGSVIRFGYAYLHPIRDVEEDSSRQARLEYEADETTAMFLSYERKIADKTGLAFTLRRLSFDLSGQELILVESSGTNPLGDIYREDRVTGSVSMTPITAGLNFHLNSNESWDIYFGLYGSYTLTDELSFNTLYDRFLPGDPDNPILSGIDVYGGRNELELEDSVGWGAVAGLDWAPGEQESVLVSARLRYDLLGAELAGDGFGNPEFQVDPVSLEVGIAFRLNKPEED
jgi:hypothetical protein